MENHFDMLKARIGLETDGGLARKAGLAADGLKKAGPPGANADEAARKRWKTSLEFEALFLGQMYKAMRGGSMGGGLTEMSPGREMFTEMLDQEYAQLPSRSPQMAGPEGMRRAAAGVSNGMAAQIYRSLSRGLETPGESEDESVVPALSLARLLGSRRRGPGSRGPGSASPSPALSEKALDPIVDQAAKTHGLSRELIQSVIRHESENRPLAVSKAGAKGLMQLMDTTATDMGVANVFNPRENVMGGSKYLKLMLDRYQGDEKLALAAYNAGPGAVDRHGGVPPFAETRMYVDRILKTKGELETRERNRQAASGEGE